MSLTRRTFASLIAATPLAAPSLVQAATPGANVTSVMLENGLQVVAIPDHRVPVVTHMLWYKVGSADEPAGKSGIAHFLEHLMFKGTAKNPADAFSKAIVAVGGTENAFTSFDYTGYYQRVASEHLAAMMAFEADRMTGLVLTDAVVDPERDVVLEERRSRTDNDPGARLSERIGAALWSGHPYGIPIIGWEREIRALTRQDALDFYKVHYAPNNAVLVVAGDVEAPRVVDMARATYGAISANPAIRARVRPPGPTRTAPERVRLADPRVAQPALSKSVVAPSYSTGKKGEAEALEVLSHALGSNPNGRIFKTLVIDRGIAANAGAFYSGGALGPGRFGIHATPRPGTTFAQLEETIEGVVAPVRRDGITEQELRRAKTRLVAESIFSQDSQSTMAQMYGASLVSGSTVEDVRDWVNRVRAVTLSDVQTMAARVLDLSGAVIGELVREA